VRNGLVNNYRQCVYQTCVRIYFLPACHPSIHPYTPISLIDSEWMFELWNFNKFCLCKWMQSFN
jgi:hypothetical protein